MLLSSFMFGNPVHQQPADAVGAFINRYQMAGAVQLRSAGETGRPGTDDGNLFASAFRRRFGSDPSLSKAVIDD